MSPFEHLQTMGGYEIIDNALISLDVNENKVLNIDNRVSRLTVVIPLAY